jgi:hypothetical protein
MADGDSRRERTRSAASEIRWMLLLLAASVVAGVVVAALTRQSNRDLSMLFATATATLVFGSLLGGVVKLLIDDFDRRRVQRAAQLDFIANVLSDLKGVHDQVNRGRTLIRANRSAKTYGEEMRGFIDARVKLQNVERALRTDERSQPIVGVRDEVLRMEGFLRILLEEYEKKYKEVSLAQSLFEAQMKRALEGPAPVTSVERLPVNQPWTMLEKLHQLSDFLRPIPPVEHRDEIASAYVRSFLQPLDAASEHLRSALTSRLSK